MPPELKIFLENLEGLDDEQKKLYDKDGAGYFRNDVPGAKDLYLQQQADAKAAQEAKAKLEAAEAKKQEADKKKKEKDGEFKTLYEQQKAENEALKTQRQKDLVAARAEKIALSLVKNSSESELLVPAVAKALDFSTEKGEIILVGYNSEKDLAEALEKKYPSLCGKGGDEEDPPGGGGPQGGVGGKGGDKWEGVDPAKLSPEARLAFARRQKRKRRR